MGAKIAQTIKWRLCNAAVKAAENAIHALKNPIRYVISTFRASERRGVEIAIPHGADIVFTSTYSFFYFKVGMLRERTNGHTLERRTQNGEITGSNPVIPTKPQLC